jgi:DegV family protein with EDD domain
MIHIVSDTLSSLPVDYAQKIGISYLPQIIIFGDESYRDDCEIDTKTFIRKMKASTVLPKTAAPPPALYNPIYEQYAANGDTVIVICPSSDLSGTCRSATVAAQDFPGKDIRIIDTRLVASAQGSVVLLALEWVKQGLGADEIMQKIEELSKRNRTYFVVDTLEYLQRGGRIGRAQALLGGILQVKPILQLKDGVAEPYENQRTTRRAMARFRGIVSEQAPHNENAYVSILEGDAMEEAKKLAADLAKILEVKDIPIFELPPAVLVHAGPGALGVSFFIN